MIQAIETRYAGHRFRSRLEARWAVFFDHLGVRWDYEPEGYLVDGRAYLPDFVLQDLPFQGAHTSVEVKGDPAKLDVDLLAATLDSNESWTGTLILGGFPRSDDVGTPTHGVLERNADAREGHGSVVVLTRVFFGWTNDLNAFYIPIGRPLAASRDQVLIPLTYPHLAPVRRVADAYDAARTARFEHGETPERPK